MRVTFFLFGLLTAQLLSAQDGAARLASLFDEVDVNEDGKISKAELESAGRRTAWHSRADLDQDGVVTREEIKAFFNQTPATEVKQVSGIEVVTQSEIPAEAPFRLAGVDAAEQYSARHNGHSFLVMLGGKVVRESYANGWDPEAGHRLASGTKSFSGVLLALAVKDGLLTLDEPVSKTITEWKEDERLAVVTFSDLLNLTSGIDPGDNGKVPAYKDVVGVKAVSGVGATFRYGPNAFQIFGEAIQRKLEAREDLPHADPLAYLEAEIFEPIGMSFTQWRRDKNGRPHLPSGAFINASEWGKFGQFLLQEGEWNGEALIDEETLRQATQPVSEGNDQYGLTFWLLDGAADAERPWLEDAYMAAGAGKQRLFVLPAVRMVVVRQGESRKFENLDFLDALFSLDSGGASIDNGE